MLERLPEPITSRDKEERVEGFWDSRLWVDCHRSILDLVSGGNSAASHPLGSNPAPICQTPAERSYFSLLRRFSIYFQRKDHFLAVGRDTRLVDSQMNQFLGKTVRVVNTISFLQSRFVREDKWQPHATTSIGWGGIGADMQSSYYLFQSCCEESAAITNLREKCTGKKHICSGNFRSGPWIRQQFRNNYYALFYLMMPNF